MECEESRRRRKGFHHVLVFILWSTNINIRLDFSVLSFCMFWHVNVNVNVNELSLSLSYQYQYQ